MVVIPGPVEFVMGSRPTEYKRQPVETQHRRRIGRTFALAGAPVTVREFRRFLKESKLKEKFNRRINLAMMRRHSPDETCPMIMLDWYSAAEYCNWLSKEEGIPEDQWCYQASPDGQVTALNANYLSLRGYRLPTEAEWEYACRAGTVTSFSYGETDELLPRYGWYLMNAGQWSRPTGLKKPNDLGLFGMHGSVSTWCQESFKGEHPAANDGAVLEDREDVLTVEHTVHRVRRGGTFASDAGVSRSAARIWELPRVEAHDCGVRPAKTFPP
jgi:formylglycine-generating enzyme required for sulfatase activity